MRKQLEANMLTIRPPESAHRSAIIRRMCAPVVLAALVSGCATAPKGGGPEVLASPDLATGSDRSPTPIESGTPADNGIPMDFLEQAENTSPPPPLNANPDSRLNQPVGNATSGSPSGDAPKATGKVGTVRPGLNLRITVLVGGQQEFNEPSRQISAQGSLDAPLIGKVQVAGLTLQQVEELLTDRYSQYLVQPQVVVEYVHSEGSTISPWGYVTVLGRVRNPGKLPIPATRDLTVSAAVQQAGGFDTSARTSSIRVTRQLATRTQRINVDLKAYAKGDLDEDITLKAGDVVFVPESPW